MIEKYFKPENNLYATIGEEGLVVLYYIKNRLAKKLFIRTTNEQDTVELRRILLNDPDAYVHIFLDILDQSYIQRTLPAISAFSIQRLATKRLEKEIPKTHLKSCLQVGKSDIGRKDWIYVFISTALEPPISTWINFFLRYQNIIHGIHFLPVELCHLIKLLKKANVQISIKPNSVKLPLLDRLKERLIAKPKENITKWEVLLTLNKSGGFRQAVFQDGKVIFTRLLNSIIDPNPDVIAGSIEQEITNSLEYLRRLSLKDKDEVYIYMIVSQDIKKNIRKNKFNAQEVHIYTPYEVSRLLHLSADITKENDRFADPLILAVMHKIKQRLITVFTEETKKIFIYTQIFKAAINSIKLFIPFILLSIIVNAFNTLDAIKDIKTAEFQKNRLNASLTLGQSTKNEEDKKFGVNIDVEQVQEIVEYYDLYKQYDTYPLEFLQKLGSIRPDISRVKEIDIKYDVPKLKYVPRVDTAGFEKIVVKNLQIIGKFTIVFKNFGSSYEELVKNYRDYTQKLRETFKDYDIEISSLPENFTFDDIKKPIFLLITVRFPNNIGENK